MYAAIAVSGNVASAFKFLAQGADLKWQNPEDEMKTVLHCAVVFDKLDCLEMLIQNGGDIFCRETRLWSPMVKTLPQTFLFLHFLNFLILIALCRLLSSYCLCCCFI